MFDWKRFFLTKKEIKAMTNASRRYVTLTINMCEEHLRFNEETLKRATHNIELQSKLIKQRENVKKSLAAARKRLKELK